MFSLTGKCALVTGATGGIGGAIAKALHAQGATVGISGRNEAKLNELAAELKDRVVVLPADLSSKEAAEALVKAAEEKMEKVDILVNNAGVSHKPAALDEISEADFDRVFNVNIKSVYLTARHLVPHFRARKTGAILNVASTAAVSPRPRLSWYNASKGWMVTATKSMAIELAPFGVRVNAINPVAGETPLLKTFMGEDTPEIRAKFLASIPLGRFSTPADMGAAAAFLCSDDASMVTGVAMEVDGGRCI